MAGFTVLSRTSSTIVVEDYRATIAIPMAAKLLIPKVQDIAAAEEFFTRKKRNESNHGKRVDFDRARALSKWVKDCNGILCEMGKRQSKLYVTIAFKDKDDANRFLKYLIQNVEGATEK